MKDAREPAEWLFHLYPHRSASAPVTKIAQVFPVKPSRGAMSWEVFSPSLKVIADDFSQQ